MLCKERAMTQFCFTHLTPCESQPAFVWNIETHYRLPSCVDRCTFFISCLIRTYRFGTSPTIVIWTEQELLASLPIQRRPHIPKIDYTFVSHPESIVAHTVHFSFWFLSLTPSVSYCLPLYFCLYPCRSLPLPFLFGQLEELDACLECKQKLN